MPRSNRETLSLIELKLRERPLNEREKKEREFLEMIEERDRKLKWAKRVLEMDLFLAECNYRRALKGIPPIS